ncbi:hypothetical protein ACN28S_26515 [Cystobacter fuscus]
MTAWGSTPCALETRTTRLFEPAAPGRRVRAEVLPRELREEDSAALAQVN